MYLITHLVQGGRSLDRCRTAALCEPFKSNYNQAARFTTRTLLRAQVEPPIFNTFICKTSLSSETNKSVTAWRLQTN
jgi:hypothetical protein